MNPIFQAMNSQQAAMPAYMDQNLPLPQRAALLKNEMEAQGVTDPKAEFIRRFQSMAIPPQIRQKIQGTAQLMGLGWF